jgi:hypothetical protein
MSQERKRTMYTETRDPQFVSYVNELAESIRWPDPSFTLTPLEVAVGVVAAFYEAFATPDRVILRHALNGIAF